MRETARAKQAWADYLAMGPDRSLEKLLERYQSRTEPVPTRQLSRLKAWSAAFGWQARLKAIADQQAREAEEREAAYRREILETGYGLATERIRSLKQLAETLFGELQDPKYRWVRDVKLLGRGESAEAIDIERFNHHEFEQFRGILDDIAKEKSERIRRTELTGKDGGPIEVDPDAGLSDQQRAARIASLLEAARLRQRQAEGDGDGSLD